ncbi:MAG: EFR1 family ferrodoxin [Clostridia bacterium]|nr:EFR1 family ferrodoxin [Clostridia bacterium]
MKKYLIHYFTGTGGTYHAVKTIGNKLESDGFEVEYVSIEKDKKDKLEDFDIHVFTYPIYGFGTPHIMINYLKKLQKVNNLKAVILSVCAGFEGQSLNHVTHILKKKGFDVFNTNIVFYPSNWTQLINPVDEQTQKSIIERAKERLDIIAKEIIDNTKSINNRSAIVSFFSWMMFLLYSYIGRRIMGKMYIADNNCNSCKKCEKICPAKVIKMVKGKPRWNWSCEGCQRCINLCPQKSIQTSIWRLAVLLVTDIIPMFLLVVINKYLSYSILSKIIIYTVLYIMLNILLKWIFDWVIEVLEGNKFLRGVFSNSFTKRFRRYFIDDFKKNLG